MRVFDDLSGRAFRFQVLNSWKNKNSSNVLTLSYMGGGGGGRRTACANFKDSYLRDEYSYCNEIWRLLIKCIEKDNGMLIKPVPIKPLPWQPLFKNAVLTIFT